MPLPWALTQLAARSTSGHIPGLKRPNGELLKIPEPGMNLKGQGIIRLSLTD
jgi:hypothetical protein